MKKAKFMLTAIAVLAIVAGALAFKAKTFETLYVSDGVHANNCDVQTMIYTRTVSSDFIGIKASIASGTSNCVTLHVTTQEQ